MPNATHASYRGYLITTRWAELDPPYYGHAKQFRASFSVDTAADELPWQQFPKAVFGTYVAAAANALATAKRSIDMNLAVIASSRDVAL